MEPKIYNDGDGPYIAKLEQVAPGVWEAVGDMDWDVKKFWITPEVKMIEKPE
jgi:hypothetical protein